MNDLSSDRNVQTNVSLLNKKLKSGNATFTDVSKLAESLAKPTAKGLLANVPETEFAEYAEQIVAPIYTATQKTVLNAGKKVQKQMLRKAKLGIEPVDVETDLSRVKHIVERFKEAESVDTVSFLLEEYVAENVLKSAVTDTIKENAQRLSNMGFETYVTRSDGAGCCDWCASMVGTYELNNLPDDFWRVHKGCSCTFEYKSKDTHDKISFSTNEKGQLTKETTNL